MRETYYLEFDDRAGTERAFFATFRLHHSWAKRLTKGRVVFLCDTKTRQVYGKAKVLDVQPGKTLELLQRYGAYSHLEARSPSPRIGARMASWLEDHGEGLVERRFASMQKRYGPNRVSETSNLTAILLKRIA
jgi:hypothetical protein